jgi:hypothetical protein
LSFSVCAAAGTADGTPVALPHKVIEYGWDYPAADYIRQNIAEMTKRPFDGVIFRMNGGTTVLQPTAWTEANFAGDYENLAAIEWGSFTDNFVVMHAASDQDWFNDEHWSAIEANVRLVARGGKVARCVGVCFDPEPYGTNPWCYRTTAHKAERSFAEYESVVRKRGAQYIRAVETEMPHPKVLSFYLFALFAEFCKPMPSEERAQKLAEHDYALYPAFLNGMLEAASEGTQMIDGNESAYYYESSAPYFESCRVMTKDARLLVDPALQGKFADVIRSGQALYVDQYFGLRTAPVTGHFMSPEDRPLWFEHNTYWALRTSDEYVWCYSERMNWWTNEGVPAGAEDALRRARQKIGKGEPLGFDIAPLIAAAHERRKMSGK